MQGHDQIGPQRYRESFGRYYDDFVVGDVYEHRPGRTITESDNTWFTLITMNTHPLHFDKVYAAKSEFKRQTPPVAKLTTRTPGVDYLYPRRRPVPSKH